MGRFDSYLTGKTEITVNGEKLELDIQMKDKRKIKAISDGKVDESKLEVIDNVIIDILKRSYPSEDPKALEAFYSKNDVAFLNEILISFGWLKRESLEQKK